MQRGGRLKIFVDFLNSGTKKFFLEKGVSKVKKFKNKGIKIALKSIKYL